MRRRRARGEVVILARVVKIDRHSGQAQRVARPAKPARARKKKGQRSARDRSERKARSRSGFGARRAIRRGRERETPGLEKPRCFAQACYSYGGPRKSPRARVASGGRGRTSRALFSTRGGTRARPNASLSVRPRRDEEATDTLGYYPRPAEIGRPTRATEVGVLGRVFRRKPLKNSSGSELNSLGNVDMLLQSVKPTNATRRSEAVSQPFTNE